jgi:histidinol-phosphatase (PHP family)
MTLADYHAHTAFSIDCDVPMEEQCRAAIAAGVAEIAFTEHVDHDECDADSQKLYDYVAYGEEVERCRELFDGQLTILRAAEIDWNRSIADDVLTFLERTSFDFTIGSVHNLNHKYVGFTEPAELGGAAVMYDMYYDEMLTLVEAGFPSVVGHMDLPRRYHGIAPLEIDRDHFEGRLREIFRTAANNGVGFEINTSGLVRGKGFSLPEPELLSWFVEEGGEVITVGSDSHRPAHIGGHIEATYGRLRDLGIDWRMSFVGGEMRRVEL